LLVGTKQGHLLVYTVHQSQSLGDARFEVQLERSNKSFARKPITQLEVVPEYHILVSISGMSNGRQLLSVVPFLAAVAR
jgi:Vam6/Vps39-like protein vacuolar protein sorting-associated protein 39